MKSKARQKGRISPATSVAMGIAYAGFFCIALSALVPASSHAEDRTTPLPPVQVDAPQTAPGAKAGVDRAQAGREAQNGALQPGAETLDTDGLCRR